jgi:hypothetical protein
MTNGDMPDLEGIEDEDEDVDQDEEEFASVVGDITDDNVDELEKLDEEEQAKILEETAAVKETIMKVRTAPLYMCDGLT